MISKRLFWCWVMVCLMVAPTQADDLVPCKLQILSEDEHGITLSVEFDRQWLAQPEQVQKVLQQAFLVWQDSIYSQPFFARPFVPFTQRTLLQILQTEYIILPVRELYLPIETPLDSNNNIIVADSCPSEISVTIPAKLPHNPLVKIATGDEWQQVSLYKLQFFPCQWHDLEQEFRFYFRIDVRLNFDFSAPLAHFGRENSALMSAPQLDRIILNQASFRTLQQQVQKPVSKTSVPGMQSASNPACNLIISREGWYRISDAELRQAGVPVDQIDAQNIHLFCKGKEVPIYFPGDQDRRFNPGEVIEFWGELNHNTDFTSADDLYYDPYFINGVYVLTWDQQPGLRYGSQNNISPETAVAAEQPHYFIRKIHLEQDQTYDRLGWAIPGTDRDHWFCSLSLGSGELQHVDFDLPLSYPYSLLPIRVKIWLHGRTLSSHRVEVYLNQHFISTGEWYGPEKFLLEAEVEDVGGAILANQQHTLTLINRSSDSLDYVLYNWAEIEYAESFVAKNNFLQFSPPQEQQETVLRFRLQNFSSPQIEVFKLGAYRILNTEITATLDSLQRSTYQVQFQDESFSGQEQYIAFTSTKKLSPDTCYVYQSSSDLTAINNQADYLIIIPEKFARLSKMQEFVDYRAKTYRVMLATVEDIYQQFGYGIPSPVAIKKFITYTRQRWRQPAPQFVLLVGDGNYNTRSQVWQRRNLIPVYHYQTYKFGAAASDHWYVTSGEDGLLPEHNIGRWPINSEAELEIVIDKTLRYEQATPKSDWCNRLLMIVGGGGTFSTQTDEMIRQQLPAPFFVDRLNSTVATDPFFGDTEQLVQRWNSGTANINFLGHGGGAVWSDNLLFRFEDVAKLENQERLPFVTSMTCFTGAFDSPSQQVTSLGEALLAYDQGGVVALFGATGVGWIWNDYYLLREILAVMFSSPGKTIGEILSLAKINYSQKYTTPQLPSMIHQYNLLGDPAVVLRLPWQEFELSISAKNYAAGDSILCQAHLPISEGRLDIELQDIVGTTVLSAEQMITNAEAAIRLMIPSQTSPGQYLLKVFGLSESGDWLGHAAAPLTVNQLSVAKIWQVPAVLTAPDSIHIFAQCLGCQSETPVQVFFVFNRIAIDSLEMRQLNPEQGLYELDLPPGFATAGEQLAYYVSVHAGQRWQRSDWQTLRVWQNPDFEIVPQSLCLQVMKNELYLTVQIHNRSDFCTDSLAVDFWIKTSTDSDFVWLGRDTLRLASYQDADAKIPWNQLLGNFRIKIWLDPEQQFADSNLADNLLEETLFADQLKVTSAIFQAGTLFGSLPPDLNFQVTLTPAALGKILRLARSGDLAATQSGLELCQPGSWQKPMLLVGFTDDETNLQATAQFDFTMDSNFWAGTKADSQIALYHYYPAEQRWAKVLDQRHSGSLWQCRVNQLGYFAWFRSSDNDPPRVSVMVQNRGFYDGGYVQPQSEFTIRIEDTQGAHPDAASLQLLLNGQSLSVAESVERSNYQNGAIFCQLKLPTLSGENSLKVQGFDCSGNFSAPVTIKFKIAANVDLLVLGNYPNPFIEQTVFCYELTQSVAELELKIFTTAGKLIRCFKPAEILDDPNPREVGYHEIPWDGLDDQGRELANGVYFYQFRVKGEGKIITKTGKLARVQ